VRTGGVIDGAIVHVPVARRYALASRPPASPPPLEYFLDRGMGRVRGCRYVQRVKANVLFFDRKPASETPWTRGLWIYDSARTSTSR
jgi:hypothetical protein